MNKDKQLSQNEAEKLIKMLKNALVDSVSIPDGGDVSFKVEGDSPKDLFIVNIFTGEVNPNKVNINARISKNNIMLLQLHINSNYIHKNPDGEKIKGSHWHYYKEGYGMKYAFPAEDVESDDFSKNTMLFFKKFNIIKTPEMNRQTQLF